MKKEIEKGIWMEEFKSCSCSYVVKYKKNLLGYCPKRGNERKYLYKLPESTEIGYAGIG